MNISVDHHLVSKVLQHYVHGHKILVRVSHLGQAKIKIQHGPLSLRTTRFTTSVQTLAQIKQHLFWASDTWGCEPSRSFAASSQYS